MPAYLKLGNYKGNVTNKSYVDWIEVESYSWGFSVPVQSSAGSSSNRVSAGKVTPGDLHLVKKQDVSSAQFMIDSMGGKNIDKAVLAVTRPSEGGAEDKYMEYTMTNVITSSFNTSGSQGSFEPMENLSLNFSKLEIAQFTRDAKGTQPAPVRLSYDFTTMAKV